jgi:hypothetical protein
MEVTREVFPSDGIRSNVSHEIHSILRQPRRAYPDRGLLSGEPVTGSPEELQ